MRKMRWQLQKHQWTANTRASSAGSLRHEKYFSVASILQECDSSRHEFLCQIGVILNTSGANILAASESAGKTEIIANGSSGFARAARRSEAALGVAFKTAFGSTEEELEMSTKSAIDSGGRITGRYLD